METNQYVTVFNLVLATVLGSIVFCILFLKSRQNYWKRRGVPCWKSSIIVGNLKEVLLQRKSEPEALNYVYNKFLHHKYFGYYEFDEPIFVVRDPHLIKQVLVKDFAFFHDRGVNINRDADPLNDDLFSMSGNSWKQLRNKLTPTFTSSKMKMMFKLITESIEELTIHIDKNLSDITSFDIYQLMENYTIDVTGSCIFGFQNTSFKGSNSEFFKIAKNIGKQQMSNFIKFMIMRLSPRLFSLLKINLVPDDITEYFTSVIKNTLEFRQDNKVVRPDFMNLLLQLKNQGFIEIEDKRELLEMTGDEFDDAHLNKATIEFTDSRLAAQAFTFAFAGFENASLSLSYCLYNLALNQYVQDKLRKEVNEAINNENLTYEKIQKMKYLDMVLNETLRLYPPTHRLLRAVLENYRLPNSNIILERGTQVIIPVYSIHRDGQFFPDPLKFDPERFSDINKDNRIPFTFLPFGDGPRMCIGLRFALLHMKTVLFVLVSKYKFMISGKTQIPIKMDPLNNFLLSPKTSVYLNIERLK